MAKKKAAPPAGGGAKATSKKPPAAPPSELQRAERLTERADYVLGYWDAHNVLYLFFNQFGRYEPVCSKAPSSYLLNALRDLAVQGASEKQEYLDGWNQRMDEFVRGEITPESEKPEEKVRSELDKEEEDDFDDERGEQ